MASDEQIWADLEKDIYKTAKEKGWWDKPRAINTILCLLHSEVSEALEAHRNGNKANFAEEIADIKIRILDAIGGYKENNVELISVEDEDQIPYSLALIHFNISHAFNDIRIKSTTDQDCVMENLVHLSDTIDMMAKIYNIDLLKEVDKKHKFNKTREFKHGNKVV